MDDFLCGTPFETQAMQERWKRLVKEAIRDKEGKVNSIAPGELDKLVREYLAHNPDRRWTVVHKCTTAEPVFASLRKYEHWSPIELDDRRPTQP